MNNSPEAWKDFLRQVEEERENMNLSKSDLSKLAFNHASVYHTVLTGTRERSGILTAEKITKALGLKLVLCMVEQDDYVCGKCSNYFSCIVVKKDIKFYSEPCSKYKLRVGG